MNDGFKVLWQAIKSGVKYNFSLAVVFTFIYFGKSWELKQPGGAIFMKWIFLPSLWLMIFFWTLVLVEIIIKIYCFLRDRRYAAKLEKEFENLLFHSGKVETDIIQSIWNSRTHMKIFDKNNPYIIFLEEKDVIRRADRVLGYDNNYEYYLTSKTIRTIMKYKSAK